MSSELSRLRMRSCRARGFVLRNWQERRRRLGVLPDSRERLLPRTASDLEYIGLLVWESDLSLFKEANLSTVV